MCKNRIDFGQLQNLTANISVMDQNIVKGKTASLSTVRPAFSKKLVNFGPLSTTFSAHPLHQSFSTDYVLTPAPSNFYTR